MDDSGYGSPTQHSETVEEKRRFYLKTPSSKYPVLVVAHCSEVIYDIISSKYPEIILNKTILLAKMKRQDGKKWVPFSLPCSFIEAESELEIRQVRSENVYNNTNNLDKTTSKPTLKHLFFVSLDRKNKTRITNFSCNKLGTNVDICVLATANQTFYQAFASDERFKDIERYRLNVKINGGVGSKVDIHDKPADHGELYLEITVSPKHQLKQSTNYSRPTSKSPSTTTEIPPSQEQGRPDSTMNELAEKLAQTSEMYIFTGNVSDLSMKAMLDQINRCVQSRVAAVVAAISRKDVNMYNKPVQSKVQFAKENIKARQVSFSKLIYPYYDSIGLIRCGELVATCFLVTNDIIATSCHVVTMITKGRHSSMRSFFSDVSVDFNYEGPRQTHEACYKYKLKPLSYEGNICSPEMDYAFLHLDVCIEGKVALGEYVRCTVPENGDVCIIGHPDGKWKKEELCPILSLDELEKRLEDKVQNLTNDPSLYICGTDIISLHRDKALLSYDVGCMFHGSSGSPVIDMDGNIVAMHTLGCYLEDRNFMEVGVKFTSIINHLIDNNHVDFVNHCFPNCFVEKMEI